MILPNVLEFNTAELTSPVVVAVPHAGRAYPASIPMLHAPIDQLRPLEDRFADHLAKGAIAAGLATIITSVPRLMIDLNRSEEDLDPAMVAGGFPGGAPLTPRARGGLGLIPRRLGQTGEIWRLPLGRVEIDRRIRLYHRPWHAALAATLLRARDRFGAALLIDLHSMPPLGGTRAPSVVIGDRIGRSAAPHLTAAAYEFVCGAGLAGAINVPYAGGHTLDRHACPQRSVHALQIEIDRSTYLDTALDRPSPGLLRMQDFVTDLAMRLGDELAMPQRLAAE